MNPVHAFPSHSLWSVLLLPFHLFPCFSRDLFPSGFPTKILFAFLNSHTCHMPRPFHPSLLGHTFIYLFIYALFYTAVSAWGCIASNSEFKRFARNISWTNWDVFTEFSWRDWGKSLNTLSQGCWCPGGDSNRAPPCTSLTLDSLLCGVFVSVLLGRILTAPDNINVDPHYQSSLQTDRQTRPTVVQSCSQYRCSGCGLVGSDAM